MEKKRIYTFGNGQAEGNAQMREQLGGKGANLAEMNLIGVPVPPGFTITTDCCNEYYEVGQEKIREQVKKFLKTLQGMELSGDTCWIGSIQRKLKNYKEWSLLF